MDESLLPINASDMERSIEQVLLRSSRLPILIDTLWNPELCPEPLLPWLAWALSVDTWDSDWTIETKRAFIANSLGVHRRKGTLASIRRVLAGLGITINIEEWFQYEGEPHTFRLTAFANDNTSDNGEPILGPSLYRNLVRVVDNVKPVRSHYDFRVGVALETGLNLGSVASALSLARVTVEARIDASVTSELHLTPTTSLIAVVRARLEP